LPRQVEAKPLENAPNKTKVYDGKAVTPLRKEHDIAWGKPVKGLQVGISFSPGEYRPYQAGESVPLIVCARNTSDAPITFTHRAGIFATATPAIEGVDGKPRTVVMPPAPNYMRQLLEQTLKAGETTELGEVQLALVNRAVQGKVDTPTLHVTPGRYKLSYASFVPEHDSLSTGQVVIEVKPADGVKPVPDQWRAGGRLAKKLVGSWGDDQASVRTFRNDGTGSNSDGSSFRWRLESDYLIAQKVNDKVPVGGSARIPILFTEDGKEYSIFLGGVRASFYRLAPNGRLDEQRTPEGLRYARKPIEENNDDAPQTVPVKPIAAPVIQVGPNVHVSQGRAKITHGEVILAADPRDSKRLVAASMFSSPGGKPTDSNLIVFASVNGGASWEPTLERGTGAAGMYADPTLAFGPDGSVAFGYMFAPSLGELQSSGRLEVVRSSDGGKTWGQATRINSFHDRPFLVTDGTHGQFSGRLYCVTHRGSLTCNQIGKPFGDLKPFQRRPGYSAFPNGNAVVLSDGTLVALHGGVREAETPVGEAKESAAAAMNHFRPRPGYLAVRRSKDGGETFSQELPVADFTFGQRTLSPVMAVGLGNSDYKDRLYVVWADCPPQRKARIMFTTSKDRGTTFSPPIILSEHSGFGDSDYDAYLPTIAVNQAGVVAVTWYDTRDISKGEAGWDVRFRASLDGGNTWSPSVKGNEQGTRVARPTKKAFGVGHTAGIASGADGLFHCLWVDGRSGVAQVWTATVEVKAGDK